MKNKIFIIEDDLLLTRMYKKAFEHNGYDADVSNDGEDALVKLKNMAVKPGVILLDLMMPKTDGLEFLKEIKNTSDLKDIPVVVFTNLSDKKEEEKAMSLGAVMYLLKMELDINDIVSKINSLFKTDNKN